MFAPLSSPENIQVSSEQGYVHGMSTRTKEEPGIERCIGVLMESIVFHS